MCSISLHLWQMKWEWFARFCFFSSMFFRRFFVFDLSSNEFLLSRFLFFFRFLFCDVLKFVEQLSNVVWASIVFFMLFFKWFVKINNFFLMMSKFWWFVNAARSFDKSLMNKWIIRCFSMYEVSWLLRLFKKALKACIDCFSSCFAFEKSCAWWRWRLIEFLIKSSKCSQYFLKI
jgi:hypothetical protein